MTDAAKAKMAMIHMHCERHLNLIAEALPKEYALTLVCRHKTMDRASILLTVDDLSKVIDEIENLQTGTCHQSPGAN